MTEKLRSILLPATENRRLTQRSEHFRPVFAFVRHLAEDTQDETLPCAGEISAPRLLSEMGTDRSRFQNADELSNFIGISPVIAASGNQSWTHRRFHCNKFD